MYAHEPTWPADSLGCARGDNDPNSSSAGRTVLSRDEGHYGHHRTDPHRILADAHVWQSQDVPGRRRVQPLRGVAQGRHPFPGATAGNLHLDLPCLLGDDGGAAPVLRVHLVVAGQGRDAVELHGAQDPVGDLLGAHHALGWRDSGRLPDLPPGAVHRSLRTGERILRQDLPQLALPDGGR